MAIGTSPPTGERRNEFVWLMCLIGLLPLVLLPTVRGMKPAWKLDAKPLGVLGRARGWLSISRRVYATGPERPANALHTL